MHCHGWYALHCIAEQILCHNLPMQCTAMVGMLCIALQNRFSATIYQREVNYFLSCKDTRNIDLLRTCPPAHKKPAPASPKMLHHVNHL